MGELEILVNGKRVFSQRASPRSRHHILARRFSAATDSQCAIYLLSCLWDNHLFSAVRRGRSMTSGFEGAQPFDCAQGRLIGCTEKDE